MTAQPSVVSHPRSGGCDQLSPPQPTGDSQATAEAAGVGDLSAEQPIDRPSASHVTACSADLSPGPAQVRLDSHHAYGGPGDPSPETAQCTIVSPCGVGGSGDLSPSSIQRSCDSQIPAGATGGCSPAHSESVSPAFRGGGEGRADPSTFSEGTNQGGSAAVYAAILYWADNLGDLEAARMAVENRYRSLTAEPEKWGKGMPAPHGSEQLIAQARVAEHHAELALKRAVRLLPYGRFVIDTKGLGEKTVGRLLGLIGDPSWHSRDNRPRTLRELYAYCGMHVVAGAAPKRRKGERSNWNGKARTRLHVIAECIVKCRQSPYRIVYDQAKASTETLEIPPIHKHNRALRIVQKAVLRDLWLVAQGRPSAISTYPMKAALATKGSDGGDGGTVEEAAG